MKTFLIPLCVVSILTTTSATGLTRYLGAGECSAPGIACESCQSSVMCVKVGEKYIVSNRQTCGDGETCLAGQCKSGLNPACDYEDLTFPCQHEGAYPHPGDWTKYVFCSRGTDGALTPYVQNCEEGAGYNPLTTYCSKDLKNIDPSTFPVKLCESQTQLPEPLIENPSIFYYCVPNGVDNKLYPYLTACPYGGIYANGECSVQLGMKN